MSESYHDYGGREGNPADVDEMLGGVRAGDAGATRRFVERYHPLVFEITRGMLRDAEQAANAERATFRHAARQLRQGEQVYPVEPWLSNIARQVSEIFAAEKREPAPRRQRARKSPIPSVLLILLLCAILLGLVWTIAGLLAKNGVWSLPDIGYGWFNENIFELF